MYKKNHKIKFQTKGESEHRKGKNWLILQTKQWVIINSPAISSLVAQNKEMEMKWANRVLVNCLLAGLLPSSQADRT